MKAEPTGFTAGCNGTWEDGKSAVAPRVLAWKQQDGQDCSAQRREDGERCRFGGFVRKSVSCLVDIQAELGGTHSGGLSVRVCVGVCLKGGRAYACVYRTTALPGEDV